MRVILDTNILIASLIVRGGTTDRIVRAWMRRAYTLLTREAQIEELRACFARPALVSARIQRHEAGRMVNRLRDGAEFVAPRPTVHRSVDPWDDYLLALAEAGRPDILVRGDKSGLLALRKQGGTRIVTASVFARDL